MIRSTQILVGTVFTLLAGMVGLSAVASAVPAPKVDVCHVDDDGDTVLINISNNAYKAHARHGDGLPGSPVPVMDGYEFAADCSIVALPPSNPGIDVEMFVNGLDADNPPGPTLAPGSTVTLTVVVTNTGDVPLDSIAAINNAAGLLTCPRSELGVGEAMECSPITVIAEPGQNFTETCVEGFDNALLVTDCDPVNYLV